MEGERMIHCGIGITWCSKVWRVDLEFYRDRFTRLEEVVDIIVWSCGVCCPRTLRAVGARRCKD